VRVDFNAVLVDFKGAALKFEGEDAKAKALIVSALLATYEDERSIAGDEKVRRYELARRVHASEGEIEASVEELTLIKTLVGRAFSPVAVGQIYQLIEGHGTATCI